MCKQIQHRHQSDQLSSMQQETDYLFLRNIPYSAVGTFSELGKAEICLARNHRIKGITANVAVRPANIKFMVEKSCVSDTILYSVDIRKLSGAFISVHVPQIKPKQLIGNRYITNAAHSVPNDRAIT